MRNEEYSTKNFNFLALPLVLCCIAQKLNIFDMCLLQFAFVFIQKKPKLGDEKRKIIELKKSATYFALITHFVGSNGPKRKKKRQFSAFSKITIRTTTFSFATKLQTPHSFWRAHRKKKTKLLIVSIVSFCCPFDDWSLFDLFT